MSLDVSFVRPDDSGALPMDWITLVAAVAFLAVATIFAVDEYARAGMLDRPMGAVEQVR